MTERDLKILRLFLESCSKAEIIKIFESVIVNYNENIEVIEKDLKGALENISNFKKEHDRLVEYTEFLEKTLEIILGEKADDPEIDLDEITECDCEVCPFSDLCMEDFQEEEVKITTGEDKAHKNSKAVFVTDLNRGITRYYKSLREASRKLKVSLGGLSEVANNKRSSIKGYAVEFA